MAQFQSLTTQQTNNEFYGAFQPLEIYASDLDHNDFIMLLETQPVELKSATITAHETGELSAAFQPLELTIAANDADMRFIGSLQPLALTGSVTEIQDPEVAYLLGVFQPLELGTVRVKDHSTYTITADLEPLELAATDADTYFVGEFQPLEVTSFDDGGEFIFSVKQSAGYSYGIVEESGRVFVERLSASDALQIETAKNLVSALHGGDGLDLDMQRLALLTSQLSIGDVVTLIYSFTVEDVLEIAEALTLDKDIPVELASAVEAVLALDTNVDRIVLAESVMQAQDYVRLVNEILLASGLEVTDTLDATITLFFQLVSALTMADEIASNVAYIATLNDSATLSDEATGLANRLFNLEDFLQGVVVLKIGDDVYYSWALNTGVYGFTEYTNFAFNSFTSLDGEYFAANDTGIYRLGGEDDDGTAIDAAVRFVLSDFGTSQHKRIKTAYAGYSANGDLILKVNTSDGQGKRQYWYKLVRRDGNATHSTRAKIGQGLRARYWQFELVNTEGADFELTDITLLPLVQGRRF